MGMQLPFAGRWAEANRDYAREQQRVSDVGGLFSSASKVFRMALQSGVLALGAWLVINNQATSGIIIASSILVSRALAPADWRSPTGRALFRRANPGPGSRSFWRASRLSARRTRCLRPSGASPSKASRMPPGIEPSCRPRRLAWPEAGQGLGHRTLGLRQVSLARALVGIWPSARGKVRLDGAALDQWEPAAGRISASCLRKWSCLPEA